MSYKGCCSIVMSNIYWGMKVYRQLLLSLLAVLPMISVSAKDAKYVFMFIGDGMGVNQVIGTEYYLADINGKVGIEPLCFAQFPVSGLVMTYSASTDITDSSAAGTALSTGCKTANNVMGMLNDKTTPVEGIAERAHKQGRRVAICSTVGVDHATPAAFYAHTANRNSQHLIASQLAESGFEFFAGGDFAQDVDSRNPDSKSNTEYALEQGYRIVRGYDEYKANAAESDKMILFQKPREDGNNTELIPSIDQVDGDLNISQITSAAVDFMMKDPSKGFFIMVEGGHIDHWLHGNDAAATFREVIDLDNAIKVAYEFYLQHKDETLIVVTADHETGGLSLGNGAYRLALSNLQYQNISEEFFSHHLEKLTKEKKDSLTWDEVKAELSAKFGFWDHVRISASQEEKLKEAYAATFATPSRRRPGPVENEGTVTQSNEEFYEYYKADKLSDLAVKTMCDISQISWGTGQHSGGYVPVFAIGCGAEQFTGQIDNIEIPVKIARASGIKW